MILLYLVAEDGYLVAKALLLRCDGERIEGRIPRRQVRVWHNPLSGWYSMGFNI